MADITHGTWIKDGKAVDAAYQSGVKVYGRNLVKDSEQEFTGKAYGFHDYNLASLSELTPGKTYTLSFSAKVDDKAVNCNQHLFVCIYNPSWSWNMEADAYSADYQRVTNTFTVTEGQTSVSNITVYLSHPVINGNSDYAADKSDVAGTGYIKELKLETGATATPHSIAPEDILK
ncbi:hypothetical protein REH36_04400 [Pediococcus pentosaceus]|uniref:hypothetical protein n=1 Tax=Pediococcus pentosaceus TaxID=1255 RepID=UPI002B4BD21B|nr:hypothetical protein [Pediococcus pentosaceus]MEB3377170.1 hypothetical protein [Pediococcus pentosaceus]